MGQRFFSLALKMPVTTYISLTPILDVAAIYILPALPGKVNLQYFKSSNIFVKTTGCLI